VRAGKPPGRAVQAGRSDVELELPPTSDAAVQARRALVDAGLDHDLVHTVSLLTSELLTNSARHAGLRAEDRIRLRAWLAPDYARVEVRDGGSGFDAEVRHTTRGHGLRLIETLASGWGAERGEGCTVWFEVDRRRRRFGR
jgi:anti-sigma regulatory factor (Ser/Thr protein kinase)